MLETERYFRVLDLEPGASPEEIHQGYLDLTWVWHPDRFAGHPRLQQKAHNKLQQLNEAHERLRSIRSTLQTRGLRTQSKPQSPPPRQQDASVESLYKSPVNRVKEADAQKTIKEPVPYIKPKARDIDAWLD